MPSSGLEVMGHMDFEQAIQSCVCMANQRPILPISNAKGQIIVSPANLLFGDYAMNYVLQFDETSTKADLRGRWKQRQQIYSSFENLWHSSYMDHIGKRSRWAEYRNNLKVGDIVLVRFPAPKKKKEYPLGLIVELNTSKDGYSR